MTPPFGSVRCPRCKGSGIDPHDPDDRPCPDCKGTGYVPPKRKE